MPVSLRNRFILLAFSAVLALTIGFGALTPMQAVILVQHVGYYFVLAATVAFVWALVRLWRTLPARERWAPRDVRLLLVSLVIAGLWQAHGFHGFKVLMDELVLNATAMSMHFDREVYVPLKTHEVTGVYATLAGIVDKRPLFFPFLLSLCHDLTGYRPGNAFGLNAVISVLLLFFSGRIARRLGGHELAGILAVLLLGGLPLLALNVTGGGFEVLNLLLIVAMIGLGWMYLERPSANSLNAFVLAGVLLAQTRYESALFIPAVAAIILAGWWRLRQPVVSAGLIATPVLLLPVPLIENVFRVNQSFWQVREGDHGPFGLHYFFGNLGGAVESMFVVDGFQLGSPVLSAVGLTCLLFLLVYVLRRPRAVATDPVLTSFGLVALVIVLNFALLLCYHWGQLQDFVATRLALPLLLLFALAAAFGFGRWIKMPAWWYPVLGVPAAWLLVGGIPISARSQANLTFLSYREVSWQMEFIRDHTANHDLFALPSSLPAIVDRRPALAIAALKERAEGMAYHLERATYDHVWVFQRFAIDPETEAEIPDKLSALGPEFILETVVERSFKPLSLARWSRLVRVDLSRQAPRPADWKPESPPFFVNITAHDPSPEGHYVEEFLRNLP